MKTFPANREDAIMFIKNAVEIIHNEQFQQSFIQALGQGDPVQVIGSQAAAVMHRLLSVMRQEKQMPISEQNAVRGIEFVVKELAAIASLVGAKLGKSDLAKAGKVAGDVTQQLMDDSERGMRQPQPSQQQAPTGLMQGGM